MESYSAITKNEIFPFATIWMDLEGIILKSYLSQIEKDKYYMISFICGILKKKKKKEQAQSNRHRVFHTENKQMVARGEGLRLKERNR